ARLCHRSSVRLLRHCARSPLFPYTTLFRSLEATRMLVADASVTAGVLILTTFDRDDYLFEALQAGASGFLLKNARAEELIDAVRSEEHTSELQSRENLVCRLLLEKKNVQHS